MLSDRQLRCDRLAAVADNVQDDIAAQRWAIFAARFPTRTTASGSSALTWKIGTDWRLAILERSAKNAPARAVS